MGGKAKLLIAIIITVIVLVIMCIVVLELSSSPYPGLFGLMSFGLFAVGILVFTISYTLIDKGLTGLYNKPTNATLTCKNGHTCRVWVNYRGEGWWYDFWKGGDVYHIGGEPAIIPNNCPECGTQWELPRKHNKHMTSERHHK